MKTPAQALSKSVSLPDPYGFIKRVKRKLNPECSVAKSPFCEQIIAMRMQAVPYKDITKWLTSQGSEYRIPSQTLWRNFDAVKMQVEMPEAEKMAEQWGGSFDYDLARMLQGNIAIQRRRIDHLLRQEEAKRITNPLYADKRIRGEMETLTMMVSRLHNMLKAPVDAAKQIQEEEEALKAADYEFEPEAMHNLSTMILSGQIKTGQNDTK